MVGWSINDMLQRMPSDHVRIVDLSAVCYEPRLGDPGKVERTKMLQKLTATKRPRYRNRCRGNNMMKRW
jgi:hypothetical protein